MNLGGPLDGRLPLRAAFFDIDGTLVGFHEKEMRDSVYDALLSLKEKGVKLFISSGRCRALIHNLRDFPFDGYITCTGALVEMGDDILYSCPVPREALAELVPLFSREGISAVAFFRDRVLRNFSNDVSRRIDELLHVGPFSEEGFEDAVRSEPVYGLTVYVDQEGEDRFLLPLLPKECFCRWHPSFIDLVPRGIDKGRAVETVCSALGITPEETVAFGDGANDLSMLRRAGLAVVMANAAPEVRAEADIVADDVDGEGVIPVLRSLFK